MAPLTPPSSTLERGATLYAANCQACHGGATGGAMMDTPPVHNANGHTWHHPDCQLADVVLNGVDEKSGMIRMMREMMSALGAPQMPAFRDTLSEEDVAAILTYIQTWWTEDQRAWQAEQTRQACESR
ncbi:MAG: cytochrome c [Candidatus Tectomicrobia bacterium]|nr:cytochrome c [Candidatus Tectomicrobia bacterium]